MVSNQLQYRSSNDRKTNPNAGHSSVAHHIPLLPMDINLLPFRTATLHITVSNVIVDPSVSKDTCTLEIPCFRHIAVKEYGADCFYRRNIGIINVCNSRYYYLTTAEPAFPTSLYEAKGSQSTMR